MATSYGSKIVNDGLVLYLDAGNSKSLKFPNKIYDDSVWTVGTSGTQGDFQIVYSNCSSIISATDPWGNLDSIWKSDGPGQGTSPSLGGIYCVAKPIDNTKLYRMSWWENRITNSTATYGRYYAGLNGYGSTNGVWALTNETYNINPYFYNTGNIPTSSQLPESVWVLIVGHVWPYTYDGGVNHVDSGRYTIDSKLGDITNDYRWGSATTTARPRTLSIYRGDVAGIIHHTCHVRMDCCDGTEPSLDDLINNVPSKIYDLSGNNNLGTQIGIPKYETINNGVLTFDGTSDYVSIPNINLGNGNLPWTCGAWIKTTTAVGNTLGAGSILSNSSSGAAYSMMGVNSGKIVYWTYQSSAWSQKLGVEKTVNDGVWHLLTWVNYSDYTMDMYVDGLIDINVANSTSGNNNPINILGGSWSYKFAGNISQVSIYNRALSPTEILQNYNALKGRYGL